MRRTDVEMRGQRSTPLKMPTRILPMLASAADAPFVSAAFEFELKWDGLRTVAYITTQQLSLLSRTFKEMLPRFPELAAVRDAVAVREAIIDGEVVVLGPSGKPDFDAVRNRNLITDPNRAMREAVQRPATFVAFDLLYLEGQTLFSRPLHERRSLLREVLREGDVCTFSRGLGHDGTALYQLVVAQDLEGLVGKRLDSLYLPGKRSTDWLKIRNVKTSKCLIGGFLPKEGWEHRAALNPVPFRALLLGMQSHSKLRYVGSAGTGLSESDRQDLTRVLHSCLSGTCPFESVPREAAGAFWVKPTLTVTVEYLHLTPNGHLRHPVLRAWSANE